MNIFRDIKSADYILRALKKASELKPNEAKVHYELGLSYLKLGQLSDVDNEYQILLLQNPQLADQLKQEADDQ